jgi:stearoyl-CoA desaturase (delta-9 desaturase)
MLSLVTFGEGYHNYHHTFQADYRNGPAWYNIDLTKWLIWVLARVGLAGSLRRMPVDVTLSRRFEQARHDLDATLRELDERARAALTAHLAPLETMCEEALVRLRAVRKDLQQGEVPRRALRTARRTARRALREWHESTRIQLAQAAAPA